MSEATSGPICNLEVDDPAQYSRRLALIRNELLPRVRRTRTVSDTVIWEFESSPEMHARLEEFVAFERTCCASVQWTVRQVGPVLELHVEGPGARTLRATVEAYRAPKGGVPLAKLVTVAGLGISSALVACCILPIGIAAMFGAAVAAPLARMDNPIGIGSVSLVFAVATWLYISLRGRRKRHCKIDRGC